MSDGKDVFIFMQSNNHDDPFQNGMKGIYIMLSDDKHEVNLQWVD